MIYGRFIAAPGDIVRLSCEKCGRSRRYRKQNLIERYGADIRLPGRTPRQILWPRQDQQSTSECSRGCIRHAGPLNEWRGCLALRAIGAWHSALNQSHRAALAFLRCAESLSRFPSRWRGLYSGALLARIKVCFWGQSRHGLLRKSAFAVAIGGKADIANTYARSDYYSAAAREPVILTRSCACDGAASASSISWLAIRGPIGSNIGVPEWED